VRISNVMRIAASSLALFVALGACTTSFEADQLRARPDATLPVDAVVDVPLPDVPVGDVPIDLVASCGAENAPCCAGDAAASTCNPNLVCSNGVCARCPGTLAACGGFCVDITSNSSNCGGCNNVCPEGNACAAGTCALSCAPGLVACAGNCTQRLTDALNCGSCGRVCALAHAANTCQSGACAVGRCDTGFGDCDQVATNGCEVSTSDDLANCGGCGVVCAPRRAASSTCAMGVCRVVACNTGFADCDGDASNGCEVDTNTNAAHCGTCPTACTGGGACVAGRCQISSCATGTADCSTGVGGCETNVTSDTNNCGACGNVCSLPNATSSCVASACAVATCAPGFGNCDGRSDNGCEADVRTSLTQCGGCGMLCAPAHATAACAAGVCGIARCDDGFGNCDGNAANGCETELATSAGNCGACGSACAAQNATASCAAGRCAVGMCSAGFADCDMNPANGCESNTSTSASNCGGCGTVCALPNATASCVAGACTLGACNAGFADCDGNPANGCESDLGSDPAHCGACPTACTVANGMPSCMSGRCGIARCNAGFADCDMNPANGCEVDLSSDNQNCGACATACATGQPCSSGMCRAGCASGLTMCGFTCVDLRTSVTNCGACGNVCSSRMNASAACASGTCGVACNTNFGNCNGDLRDGCEVDLRASLENCGACGRRCPSGSNSTPFCSMSTCGLRCDFGSGNCDGSASNGCEARLASDPNNCGRCGMRCQLPNASSGCTVGICTVTSCNTGYRNCNLSSSDGCETNVLTDSRNCGGCGTRCSSGQVCRAGECVAP
jgi:hypothetical protein